MHWNNITLISDGPIKPNGGYSYGQMLQILTAANTTRQDIMMWWFSPDMTEQLYVGTDSELTRVRLPQPSEACLESRPPDKCSNNREERLGIIQGSCDYATNQLSTVISTGLLTATTLKDDIDRSPALDFFRQIRMPALSLETLLRDWVTISPDPFHARRVACQWTYDNIDVLKRFSPHSYPRTIVKDVSYSTALLSVGVCLAALATVVVVAAIAYTIMNRNEKVMVYSKVGFLIYTLVGKCRGCLEYFNHPVPLHHRFSNCYL